MCNSFREVAETALKGGLAGIAICLFVALAVGSLPDKLTTVLQVVFFGFGIGTLISSGNHLTWYLIELLTKKKHNPLLINLLISYIISVLIFYGAIHLIRPLFCAIFHIPGELNPLYISLGSGVISAMVGLFILNSKKQAEILHLERNNRELAVVDERNRIARELHDSVSQNLFGISLHLDTLEYVLEQDPRQAREISRMLREMVCETQTEMRLMIHELRPVALAEKGFFEAVENLLSLFRERYRLEIQSNLQGDEHLDSRKQLVLYRVLQEALNNVVQHSKTTQVRVGLVVQDGYGELQVRDRGAGFNPSISSSKGHLGIKGMQDRVAEQNGAFTLESQPGQGTWLKVRV